MIKHPLDIGQKIRRKSIGICPEKNCEITKVWYYSGTNKEFCGYKYHVSDTEGNL
jgi:hypothetical protein